MHRVAAAEADSEQGARADDARQEHDHYASLRNPHPHNAEFLNTMLALRSRVLVVRHEAKHA